jgi:hypothetical protein
MHACFDTAGIILQGILHCPLLNTFPHFVFSEEGSCGNIINKKCKGQYYVRSRLPAKMTRSAFCKSSECGRDMLLGGAPNDGGGDGVVVGLVAPVDDNGASVDGATEVAAADGASLDCDVSIAVDATNSARNCSNDVLYTSIRVYHHHTYHYWYLFLPFPPFLAMKKATAENRRLYCPK